MARLWKRIPQTVRPRSVTYISPDLATCRTYLPVRSCNSRMETVFMCHRVSQRRARSSCQSLIEFREKRVEVVVFTFTLAGRHV